MIDLVLAIALVQSSPASASAHARRPPEPCPALITALIPKLIVGRLPEDLQQVKRVELRSCRPADNLQIVAWEERLRNPSLMVETDDFTVTQLFVRHNVFIIETARGAYDTVVVIVYEKGQPRLALQQTVREPAAIEVSGSELKVTLTAEKGATRSYTYVLSAQ